MPLRFFRIDPVGHAEGPLERAVTPLGEIIVLVPLLLFVAMPSGAFDQDFGAK